LNIDSPSPDKTGSKIIEVGQGVNNNGPALPPLNKKKSQPDGIKAMETPKVQRGVEAKPAPESTYSS